MMTSYRLGQIVDWIGGTYFKSGRDDVFSELLFDSRRLYNPESSLFVALKSSRNDGHKFIPELIIRGVHNFLVEEIPTSDMREQANFLVVKNSLAAMQTLASKHRQIAACPVLGITGSNGKTIVKEWLYELLSPDYKIVRSPKSYNSQIGVPVSVWQVHQDVDLAIIEAGISRPGEMEVLEKIIKPDFGIFTNIGSAHSESFHGRADIVREKLNLFRGVQRLFYCRDHVIIHDLITESAIPSVSWGEHLDSSYRVTGKNIEKSQTHLSLETEKGAAQFVIPFSDPASIENAIHCIVFCLFKGLPEKIIQQRLSQLHKIEMRLELSKGIHNCTIINDSYSADIESLKIALDYMVQQLQFTKRTAILSDFRESEARPDKLYRDISEMLKAREISRLIFIGDVSPEFFADFSGEKIFFQSTAELLLSIQRISFRSECILLKGARVFAFERIADALQEKSHETILEVNLSAMLSNLNHYRSLLPPGVKTMAMVKAFSYGSGSWEVANLLQTNRADYLAVAYADEGVELRQAGINLPIMVMNPEPASLETMINYGLEPEIYNFRILDLFFHVTRNFSGFNGQPSRVHLKLDTGMHRLGFQGNEIPEIISRLKKAPWIQLASVFSHLAASGEKEHDDFTALQLHRFRQWTNQIEEETGYKFIRHMLNSAGISRHPDGVFDMVRLGIGLYGIGSEQEQNHLIPVGRLKTKISQIHYLDSGETVGYSRKGIITGPSRIATIPIGYADGFSRKLGNGKGIMFIRGKQAPTIGNICMDMCSLDITSIPEAQEGDDVIVFDSVTDINRMARQLETIPYEILTGISSRVKRLYYQE